MDRDSDVYELFIQPRMKNEDWIVRVCQDRCLEDENDRLKKYLLKNLDSVI